jgi:hypothetical protein
MGSKLRRFHTLDEQETLEPFTPSRKDIVEALALDWEFKEAVEQLYQDFYLGIKHTR